MDHALKDEGLSQRVLGDNDLRHYVLGLDDLLRTEQVDRFPVLPRHRRHVEVELEHVYVGGQVRDHISDSAKCDLLCWHELT